MAPPQLTFCCELESGALDRVFSDETISLLQRMGARLSLGLLDRSQARVQLVKRLNRLGIPLVAWLLLPKEEGYWFNAANYNQATACYNAFKSWTQENGLQWDAVGVDIEPDIHEFEALFENRRLWLRAALGRLVNRGELPRAVKAYRGLVAQMHTDGYRVESYHFPFIADERRVGSQILQRTLGLVEFPVDKEVWMLYTSVLRPHGVSVLASYAPQAQALALGSTGGGLEMGDTPLEVLSWEELSRDLRLAWHWCPDIYIFSLEGCLRQGYLDKLASFEWDLPILLPEAGQERVDSWRGILRAALWALAHIKAILISLAGTYLIIRYIRRLMKT